MFRIVASTVAALALCLTMIGCSNEAADAADELGVEKGRRDTPATQRQPPGPPDGKLVTEEEPVADDEDKD